MTKRLVAVLVLALIASCLLPIQAFAVGYIDTGLPQPDGFDPWMGGSFDTYNTNGAFNIYPEDAFSFSGFVSAPVIVAEPTPIMGVRGGIPDALRVDAYSPDGGFLRYQWYMSFTGGYNDLFPINGAENSSYTPTQELGTAYYCVGVCNVQGGMRSDEIFSNIVPVTYSGIVIANAPNKLNYTKGSAVDLTGLVVNVFDGFSYSWQSLNGNGLTVYPAVLDSLGSVAVEVSYNGSSDVFFVNVSNKTAGADPGTGKSSDGTAAAVGGTESTSDGSHVHSFGEWEVVKPATCVTTGTESRTCGCGESETREIPRTDHTWDDGVVTKEATDTSNGAKLFTCTICKANKSEIIPAGSKKAIDAQAESLNINGGDPEKTNSAYNSQPAANQSNAVPSNASTGTVSNGTTGANGAANVAAGNVDNKGDSSGWWLIPASALLLVGTGTGAYYVMKKKGGAE